MWVRKLLRPLIPDAVMAKVRLGEHSRQVRVNVDVVVEERGARRRWLATTPDTYRVRSAASLGRVPEHEVVTLPAVPQGDAAVVVAVDGPVPATEVAAAARLLSDPEIDVGIVGEAVPPGLVARRRTEPVVAPRAIAVRREAWDEVGGPPVGDGAPALPGFLDRLRASGRWQALQPTPPTGTSPVRRDPITTPGAAVVLAVVPLHDVGGGSRGAQLALELLRQGWHVTYVAQYGSAEAGDLGMRHVHPQLELRRADQLDVEVLADRVRSERTLVIAEAPLPGYLDPFRALARRGWTSVYELIDDWRAPSLGGDWYAEDVERAFCAAADMLAGSAPDLVRLLQERTGRDVELVPNAVNEEVFGVASAPEPADLPRGDGPLLGYHGSLYGDWFDWKALHAVAEGLPSARIAVIGDVPERTPAMPPNVAFLGLKPQIELPGYLQRLDVGLLPFTVTDVTHAVSPLKVYEYLASGVPVAAPPLRALEGLDGIRTDTDLVAAVRAALEAPRPDRAAVLAEHSWASRVAALAGRPVGAGPDPTVLTRPVVHHRRAERVLQ